MILSFNFIIISFRKKHNLKLRLKSSPLYNETHILVLFHFSLYIYFDIMDVLPKHDARLSKKWVFIQYGSCFCFEDRKEDLPCFKCSRFCPLSTQVLSAV